MSRMIEEDGPRQIHWALGSYVASCHDCRWAAQFRHRVDAEDALDTHHCQETT